MYISIVCVYIYVYAHVFVWVTAFLGPPRFVHPQEPDTRMSLGSRVLEFWVQGETNYIQE